MVIAVMGVNITHPQLFVPTGQKKGSGVVALLVVEMFNVVLEIVPENVRATDLIALVRQAVEVGPPGRCTKIAVQTKNVL